MGLTDAQVTKQVYLNRYIAETAAHIHCGREYGLVFTPSQKLLRIFTKRWREYTVFTPAVSAIPR